MLVSWELNLGPCQEQQWLSYLSLSTLMSFKTEVKFLILTHNHKIMPLSNPAMLYSFPSQITLEQALASLSPIGVIFKESASLVSSSLLKFIPPV